GSGSGTRNRPIARGESGPCCQDSPTALPADNFEQPRSHATNFSDDPRSKLLRPRQKTCDILRASESRRPAPRRSRSSPRLEQQLRETKTPGQGYGRESTVGGCGG